MIPVIVSFYHPSWADGFLNGIHKESPTVFFNGIFYLFSILTIALSAAHAQVLRSDRIANAAVSKIESEADRELSEANPVHVRDLFDILRTPTLTRLGPIIQLLLVNYHGNLKRDSRFPLDARRAGKGFGLFYLPLKLISFLLLFLVPGKVLYDAFLATRYWASNEFTSVVNVALFATAAICLYIVIFFELVSSVTFVICALRARLK